MKVSTGPQTIDFGLVKIGAFKDTSIVVTDQSLLSYMLDSIRATSPFTSLSSARAIAPFDSVRFPIRFTPTTVGKVSGTVTFLGSELPANPFIVNIIGTGTNGNSVIGAIASATLLESPVPNPSSGISTIRFHVIEQGQVSLILYDMLGREITRLYEGNTSPGVYTIPIPTTNLSSGRYLVTLRDGSTYESVPYIFMK